MVAELNKTSGVHNIRDMNFSSGPEAYNGTSLQDFSSRIGDIFVQNIGGSYEMTGVVLLLLMGVGLHKSEASTDTSAAVMLPSIFFLGYEGFLPAGEGIIFASLIVATAVGIFGIFKYATR